MKKIVAALVLLFIMVGCNSPAPLEYYKRCVVNTAYVQHYGVTDILDLLNHPNLKYNEDTKRFDTVSYVQMVTEKIAYEQELLDDVNRLKVTTDAKQMIGTSKEVFEWAMNGQKNYYIQLAKMKDSKADPVAIQSKAFQLLDSSEKKMNELLNLLWGYGKMYSDANGIDLSLTAPSRK